MRKTLPLMRILLLAPLVWAAVVVVSCSRPAEKPRVTSKDELLVYLDSLERRYEVACIGIGLSCWNGTLKEGASDPEEAWASMARVVRDTGARAIVEEWKKRSGSLADKLLARRLELWRNCFIGGEVMTDSCLIQGERALRERASSFRFTLEGKPCTFDQRMAYLYEEKKQSRRHKAWSALGDLSARSREELLRLVKARNEKARSLGFPNYYSLLLSLETIDEEWLLGALSMLEEQTRPAYEECLSLWKKKLHVEKIGPWDFQFALRDSASLPDRFFPADSVMSILHAFIKGIGFKADSLPIRVALRPGFSRAPLAVTVNIPGDARLVLAPEAGEGSYRSAFSEYGRLLKTVHTRVAYPILKGYGWIPGTHSDAFESGVAEMHAEFAEDSLWLATYTKAKPRQIEKYRDGCAVPALYRLRQLLKDFFVEYSLYKNPAQDMAACERAMFQKYLLVDIGEEEPAQYGASVVLAPDACSLQDQILARMIGAQIQEALSGKFGPSKISSPGVAAWLIDHLYRSGETLEWTERIRNTTGKLLETGAYLRALGIQPPVPTVSH
jgi:peptidyl-dipeptidase A